MLKIIATEDEIRIEAMEIQEETETIRCILEEMNDAPSCLKQTIGFAFLRAMLSDRLERNRKLLAACNN